MDEFYKEIGLRIYRERLKKGYTQDILAEYVGVGRNTISRYENGQRTLLVHTLCQIADCLQIDVKVLIPS